MAKFLVTGTAGFIGFHLTKKFLDEHHEVIGVDNLNSYYDVNLKKARLQILQQYPNFVFYKTDLIARDSLNEIFQQHLPTKVFHLAAQAGVRYSLKNPYTYIDSNISGFINILECCRHNDVQHLIFASSSSVYGANTKTPFSENDNVDHPISLYAASKKANELMAHSYSHLYGLPTTGIRFFTVYGPWGRPDMALFIFTKAILESKPIDVFNHGNMKRDFTYIDDIIDGIVSISQNPPCGNPDWNGEIPDPSSSKAPYKIYNIGNGNPIDLQVFIELIEKNLGISAQKHYLPMQPGDVHITYADISNLQKDTGFRAQITVEQGIAEFVEWYRSYYKV